MKLKVYAICFLFILIFIPNCDSGKESHISVDPFQVLWTWDEDQNQVTEKNIWNGCRKDGELFYALDNISRFAVWKKSTPETLYLEYMSRGESPVKVFINGIPYGNLDPVSNLTRVPIKVGGFYKGLNFIEFRKRKSTEFFIREIVFSEKAESTGNNFVIEKNEKVHIPMGAGSGSLILKGTGKLSVKVYDAKTSSILLEKKLSNLFLFVKKKLVYNYAEPFVFELEALKGNYRIHKLSYSPKKSKRTPPTKHHFKKPFPDIFIFLIDGSNVNHLSAYGYSRKTSQNIDKLAEDSVVFENAYTNAVFTRAAVATIFTGFFPEHHKVRVMRHGLSDNLFTLPEFLKRRNYRTSIFSSSANISASFGFKQGVDEYFNYFRGWRKRKREIIPSDFIKWLEKTNEEKPRFSYVHFKEPHLPIIPPPPFLNMYKKKPVKDPVILRFKEIPELTPEDIQDLIDDYDSTVTYVDHLLGQMWDYLKEADLYDDSLIIFLSDHGEALYEHGFLGHGHQVYEENAHIPLVVKFPSYLNIKGRVQTVVQTTDIFTAIARLFRSNRKFDGQSLIDAYYHNNIGDEFAVSRNFLKPGGFGIRWQDYFYVIGLDDFTEKLYDVTNNPGENIVDNKQALSLFLRTKFLKWLRPYQTNQRKEKTVDIEKLSEEELENLRSLGYIK
jgi:arylsulfatase A-like enzyme